MTTTQATRCARCNRVLTSPTSIRRGYGPGCAARIRHTADHLADFTPRQVEQARELIEDRAVVHLRSTVFVTVASDGAETYYSHPTNCTCPGGNRDRRCYHMAAARMMLAA